MNAPASADDDLDRRDSVVLLVNTGTPAAPRRGAVRHFLSRFLTDRRVIELPRVLWLPLLYCVVLPLRAPRSAHRYRLIWRPDGSPLLLYTSQLRAALERELQSAHAGSTSTPIASTSTIAPAMAMAAATPTTAATPATAATSATATPATAPAPAVIRVEQAFLYSAPQVGRTLQMLRAARVRRLLVLPLFPQASGTTTGAVYDQVARALACWRTLPELRYVAEYYDEPGYIAALAASVRAHWQQHGRGDQLLISFHGIPQAYVKRGDRYADQCRDTAERLAAALELTAAEWTLSFQSRFGANRWLKPATATTLHELPRRGIRAVTVICPGFAVDCLETLEEIALGGRDIFLKAGGERFDYVPALNAGAEQVCALARLITRVTGDWA